MPVNAKTISVPQLISWRRLLTVAGPGIVVMLADTDAGSIITAAQSGAQWGYKLLLLQFILIPVLFIVQELTVRLGIASGKGHAALIADNFGRHWAWLSVATLIVACIGALLTELSGLAGVGDLLGVPPVVTMALTVAALILMAVSGSYKSVERIAIGVGLFELAFLIVAVVSHPSITDIARDSVTLPIADPKYLLLVSANIGAVIMPWMVFYQQSAVVEKGLRVSDLPAERIDTAFGSVITQAIMAAVLVAAAATLSHGKEPALDTVAQIADALTNVLGVGVGRLCFGLGIAGASTVAAIVVTLTAARTLGELLGFPHHLSHSVKEAPWFYIVYALTLVVGASVVLSGLNLVKLAVWVQVMNALLLPVVLGFLFLLARRLPSRFRLGGAYAFVVGTVMTLTVLLGLYAGVAGIISG